MTIGADKQFRTIEAQRKYARDGVVQLVEQIDNLLAAINRVGVEHVGRLIGNLRVSADSLVDVMSPDRIDASLPEPNPNDDFDTRQEP